MSNLDEPNGSAGDPGQNGEPVPQSRDVLEQRVRDLERENAGLKAELADLRTQHQTDRDLLMSFIPSDLRRTRRSTGSSSRTPLRFRICDGRWKPGRVGVAQLTPAGPYEVLYSGAIRERVQRLFQRAAAAGIGQRAAHALQFVEGHLTLDPGVWGERSFRLNHSRMDVYQRVHDGLYVVFAVREDERRVWLTRLYLIVGDPLHDPNERPEGPVTR